MATSTFAETSVRNPLAPDAIMWMTVECAACSVLDAFTSRSGRITFRKLIPVSVGRVFSFCGRCWPAGTAPMPAATRTTNRCVPSILIRYVDSVSKNIQNKLDKMSITTATFDGNVRPSYAAPKLCTLRHVKHRGRRVPIPAAAEQHMRNRKIPSWGIGSSYFKLFPWL